MFSPANTLSRLSAYDHNGLYFRTAPSNILQAHVLAAVVASDNINNLCLLVLDDTYGKGLAEDLAKSFSLLGSQILDKVFYSSGAQSSEDVIDRIKAKNPAGIVIIGFGETSRLLALMVENGIGPTSKKVYGVDGNMSDTLGELFDGSSDFSWHGLVAIDEQMECWCVPSPGVVAAPSVNKEFDFSLVRGPGDRRVPL